MSPLMGTQLQSWLTGLLVIGTKCFFFGPDSECPVSTCILCQSSLTGLLVIRTKQPFVRITSVRLPGIDFVRITNVPVNGCPDNEDRVYCCDF
jgi:hypothetical protein